jgi:hypothetical protein
MPLIRIGEVKGRNESNGKKGECLDKTDKLKKEKGGRG